MKRPAPAEQIVATIGRLATKRKWEPSRFAACLVWLVAEYIRANSKTSLARQRLLHDVKAALDEGVSRGPAVVGTDVGASTREKT